MKPLFALITDLHFGQRNFNKAIFQTQLSYFQDEFFPYLLKHNIKKVFCLGDFFHNRNLMDIWILTEIKTKFLKWFQDNDIEFHVILGNHCCYYKSTNEYNSLNEIARENDKFIIYHEPVNIQVGKYTIGLIPWIHDISEFKFPKKVDMLFGHFDIKDMTMMKNIKSHDGFSVEDFKDYKYVFSGHYHVKSEYQNIHYIGTQYQLTWNDYDEEKGFYVFYDEDFKFEFIKNTSTPKFIKITYEESEDGIEYKSSGNGSTKSISVEDVIELAKNNYIRVYTKKILNPILFDKFYNSLVVISKNDYKIDIINTEEVIETLDLDSISESIDNEMSTLDLIINFIDGMTFEPSIKNSTLINMAKEFYKEANDEALQLGEE